METADTTPQSNSVIANILQPLRLWWRDQVVAGVEHRTVIDKVDGEAGWSARYAFMILMSAGIAVLGLLLSSPAVIIGAMLISPLMGPILALGFAMALVDGAEIRRALASLAGGILMAIAFTALVVLMSPIQDITPEIAARTRPNLFDLLVALFSALAGTYAMIRGREGTIVGVAIATSLMPPLAVVGFGLATWNWTVFSGALLLFMTNFMTIALAAAIMARLYGFGPKLSARQGGMQIVFIVTVFMLLAVPLGYSLRQIAWEARTQRQARDVISEQFDDRAKLEQLDIDYETNPIRVRTTVLTPVLRDDAERNAAKMLSALVGDPVSVRIEQFRVGSASGDAEAAQISAARAREQANSIVAVEDLAAQLALIAGTSKENVTVDADRKRAQVRAAILPGSPLASYRALERRLADNWPGWTIFMQPPALALPPVSFDGDAPDSSGTDNLALAIWAAQRTGLGVLVDGPVARRDAVAGQMRDAGVNVQAGSTQSGDVRLRWNLTPADNAGN